MKSLSRVQLFVTPWTAADQVPPSMGFSRQEYWSGVPLPSPAIQPPLLQFNAKVPCQLAQLRRRGTALLELGAFFCCLIDYKLLVVRVQVIVLALK